MNGLEIMLFYVCKYIIRIHENLFVGIRRGSKTHEAYRKVPKTFLGG